jgi:hypothetical protein
MESGNAQSGWPVRLRGYYLQPVKLDGRGADGIGAEDSLVNTPSERRDWSGDRLARLRSSVRIHDPLLEDFM